MKKRIPTLFIALVMSVFALCGCDRSTTEITLGDAETSEFTLSSTIEDVDKIPSLSIIESEEENPVTIFGETSESDLPFIPLFDLDSIDDIEVSSGFDELFMNAYIVAIPADASGVQERDWSRYTSDNVKANLSDAEAKLYDCFYSICESYLEQPESYKIVEDNYYISSPVSYSSLGLTQSEAINVYLWFTYNNPQFYFVSSSSTATAANIYIRIYDFVIELPDFAAATNELFDKLDSWIEECSDDEVTVWDKITSANSLICDSIIYSPALKAGDKSASSGINQSMYSLLMTDETVCAGYAKTFCAMANAMGIDTYTVISPKHGWNLSRFSDGKYYYVDVTGNDLDSEGGTTENFIGVGTECIANSDFQEVREFSERFAPAVSADDYNGDDITGVLKSPALRVGGRGGRVVKVEWDEIPGAERYQIGIKGYNLAHTTVSYAFVVIPEGFSSADVEIWADGVGYSSRHSQITVEPSESASWLNKPSNVMVDRTEDGLSISWNYTDDDGWVFIAHGEDSSLTHVYISGTMRNNSVLDSIICSISSEPPVEDIYFSVITYELSDGIEIYSEPVQFSYNINDGMRFV